MTGAANAPRTHLQIHGVFAHAVYVRIFRLRVHLEAEQKRREERSRRENEGGWPERGASKRVATDPDVFLTVRADESGHEGEGWQERQALNTGQALTRTFPLHSEGMKVDMSARVGTKKLR
jgi:hypothetical protein